MNAPGKKWIVGLDLRPLSQGAARFGAWLAERSPARGGETLIGVHVIEEDHLRAALRYHHLDDVLAAARESVEHVVHKLGLDKVFSEIQVVQGMTAEKSLEVTRERLDADGIIIGRYAYKEGVHVRRLGRVARRVLRTLSSPVVVVPPDWDPPQGDVGPVITACNLEPDAVQAMQFGDDASARLAVDLLAMHVVPLPDDYGAHYIPEASLAKARAEHQQEGEAGLTAYCKEHGFDRAHQLVAQGGVVESLCHEAQHRNAAMLVTGSRRLSTFDRWFLTSIGSELASMSTIPVAVVPPAKTDEGQG